MAPYLSVPVAAAGAALVRQQALGVREGRERSRRRGVWLWSVTLGGERDWCGVPPDAERGGDGTGLKAAARGGLRAEVCAARGAGLAGGERESGAAGRAAGRAELVPHTSLRWRSPAAASQG